MITLCSLLIVYVAYHWIRITTAKVEIELKDTQIEVYTDLELKNLLKKINGRLTSNPQINTTKLGKKTIKFTYINDQGIKLNHSIEIKIVDKTPPVVGLSNSLSITTDYEKDLEQEIFCGDNYDDKPKCQIIGEYDSKKVGNYFLTYKATDSSNNTTMKEFTLYVKEKERPSKKERVTKKFEDVIKNYKTKKNKIGIDVSHWQGNIDYEKVRDAGVEFVFIRIGSQKGINGEYYLDPKFKENIEGFKKVGIPIGIYFYSYANNESSAVKEAKWIVKQLKNYEISLPIVFDWENWSIYQEFNLSFYHLTEIANTFIKTIRQNGYDAMLYSSKNYLENIWYEIDSPIWLAHYTDKTNYQGNYNVWQMCENGSIAGITENTVDINIMYEE